jgi:hypothetical protein
LELTKMTVQASHTKTLSRRGFLTAAAGALSIGTTPARAYARSDLRAWKVGTSTRLWEESSAAQFAELKRAGMQALELGVPRMDTPEAVARYGGLIRQAREWAGAAEIELWSLHLPFGKDLDLSNPSETERRDVVRRLGLCFEAYAPLGVKKIVPLANSEMTEIMVVAPDPQSR